MNLVEESTDRYVVVIHLPMYDDPGHEWEDDISHISIGVNALSDDEAYALGRRYIRIKKQSRMGRYWNNAEVVSVLRVSDDT